MNEDAFNMSVRKFLKKVGVTAQREIEQAVRDAAASGKLKSGALPAKATFTIGGVNLTFDVTGEVETGCGQRAPTKNARASCDARAFVFVNQT
jgi:hypothetical protein